MYSNMQKELVKLSLLQESLLYSSCELLTKVCTHSTGQPPGRTRLGTVG